jgi:hypothetical protein
MSNVLVGIIGVILFVGLAVAGALFLGQQFTNAAARTNATIIVGQLQQMTQAVEMYRLKTGSQSVTCQTVAFLVPRFLKKIPVSPTLTAKKAGATTYFYTPQLNNDLRTDPTSEQAAGVEAKYITTNLGGDATAKEACKAISDYQTKGIPTVDPMPTEKSGCGFFQEEYVAWIRL